MVAKTDAGRYAAEHPSATKLLPSGKLQFTKTGMEFASTTPWTVLDAYASGRAYKRALQLRANEGYDFAQHEPYIVPHKHRDEKHFLFCKLTESTLPRQKDVVIGHVKGKRFQRRFKEAEEKRQQAERAEEVRKEKREMRKEALRKKEDEAMDDQAGDGKDEDENEAPDVLDGIVSDEDEEMKDETGEDGEDNVHADGGDSPDKVSARMEEDEKEEAVFWTRGRRAEKNEHDDGEGGAENEEKPITKRTKKPKSRTKLSSKKEKPSTTVEMDHDGDGDFGEDDPSSVKSTIAVVGKRSRTEKLPKKVRRARQKRKSNRAET